MNQNSHAGDREEICGLAQVIPKVYGLLLGHGGRCLETWEHLWLNGCDNGTMLLVK